MSEETNLNIKNKTDVKDPMREMLLKSISERKTKYRMLNKYAKKGQTVFTGSSLMEFFPIDEMQLTLGRNMLIYNRGIAGATTDDFLDAMDECIFDLEPAELFINIGSNDIGSVSSVGYKPDKLIVNYSKILDEVKKRLPKCTVYIMAFYPVNPKDDFGLDKIRQKEMFRTRTNENIEEANKAVRLLAQEYGYNYINVNKGLIDGAGNLKKEFTLEGIHLWPNAYAVILENLKEYL